jgi:anti-anti-sigma regulatory factor
VELVNVEEALRRIEDLVAVVQEFVDNAATTDQAGVTVDLSDLSYADDAGGRALEELREREPVLRGLRPYLALLLEQHDANGRDP